MIEAMTLKDYRENILKTYVINGKKICFTNTA